MQLILKNIVKGKYVKTEKNGKVTLTAKLKEALAFYTDGDESQADAESTLERLNQEHKDGYVLQVVTPKKRKVKRPPHKKSQHAKFSAELSKKLSDLKAVTADMIEANLDRLRSEFHDDDMEPMEFFSFQAVSELGIEGIKVSGELYLTALAKGEGRDAAPTIRGYIEDDLVSLDNAIHLLCELEQQ
jgi:hypothetical protein